MSAPLYALKELSEPDEDFLKRSETIREWVNGGSVNTVALLKELMAWTDHFSYREPGCRAAANIERSRCLHPSYQGPVNGKS